jgi:hypothetical protein
MSERHERSSGVGRSVTTRAGMGGESVAYRPWILSEPPVGRFPWRA